MSGLYRKAVDSLVQSGQLNRRIRLGNMEMVRDSQGFQKAIFHEIANPWAKVTNVADSFNVNEDKESVMRERLTFEIYYRPGVTNNMSIEFMGKRYAITAIFNPRFENETLILTGERDTSRGG